LKPLFIALEGIDGSGKSTQISLLSDKLTSLNHKVHTTFEPTDSVIGKIIREIFAGKRQADQKVIAALFGADRLDHILSEPDGLLGKRQQGYTLISDRYYLSSYAYHGAHVDMDWVMDINTQAAMLLKPDLHVYIDISPEISMKRIQKNRESVEIYETLDNLKLVHEKYEEAFVKVGKSERIARINGDRPIEDIAVDIWREVQRVL
jgi:dTMP kinase